MTIAVQSHESKTTQNQPTNQKPKNQTKTPNKQKKARNKKTQQQNNQDSEIWKKLMFSVTLAGRIQFLVGIR